MDIKSKSIKYNIVTKTIVVILSWISFACIIGSSLFFIDNEYILRSNSYFETANFTYEFSNFIHNIVELNTKLIDEENIKNSGDGEYVIKDNLDRLKRINSKLSNNVNFVYLIKDLNTNNLYTNITIKNPENYIRNQHNYVSFTSDTLEYPNTLYYVEDLNYMLRNTNFEIYAGIKNQLEPGDLFYDNYTDYNFIKSISKGIAILLISSTICFFGALTFLLFVSGKNRQGNKTVLAPIDRIYTDIHTAFVVIAAFISIMILSGFHTIDSIFEIVSISIILSIDYFIGLSYLLSMVRQFKSRQLIKNSLTYKIFNKLILFLKLCFSGKIFRFWIIILLLAYGAFNTIIFTLSVLGGFQTFILGFLFLSVFNIIIIILLAKSLVSLSKIMEATKEISNGNLDYQLNMSNISLAFFSFAKDIQHIQAGLKKAVDEAVKGERMKTDLITNVSHDLKTPLTSIITYVDLLNKENLDNETAKGYVKILEEKSHKLKLLIENLIEASKASSGNLSVNLEQIDLYELMQQAFAEYEETLNEHNLELRINNNEQVLVLADGRYIWRVLENLISNVIKYSLINSRVYVDIYNTDNYGILTIKNISSAPLDISPEQLTERFIRGDESRTTEGSGLGLSIAESLTKIQNGNFSIEIDGDLFKTSIAFPLWVTGT